MDSDEDDVPLASMSKKVKKVKTKGGGKSNGGTVAKKRKRVEPDEAPSSSKDAKKAKTKAPKAKELKKLDRSERMQYAMQAFLWWNAKEPPAGCQWLTMEHAGVSFPETYIPHGIKMNYDGKPVELTPTQEEA